MKFFLPVFLLFLAVPLMAQETLTLDKALSEVLEANHQFKAEGLKLGIKKRDKDWALNRIYPTVTVGSSLVNLSEVYPSVVAVNPVPVPKAVTVTPNSVNLALSLNAQLVLSAAAFAGIQQAAIDYENGKLSFAQLESRLIRDTKKLFFQILVMQETLGLTKRQLDNAQERYRQAKLNFQGGQTSELNVIQAQVAWENRKPGYEDLKLAVEQLLYSFENLLGRPCDPELKLVGSLEITLPGALPKIEDLTAKYLGQRLDVQIAEGQLKFAEGLLWVQDSQILPVLSLGYTLDPTLNGPFESGTSWETGWHQRSGGIAISLGWKLDNFIPTGAFDNHKQDLLDQAALARVNLEQTKLAAQTEFRTLSKRIQKSLESIKTLDQTVSAAKRLYDLTETAYKTGARNLLDVQDADLQYQAAVLALLNEKQQLNSAILDMELASGKSIGEINGSK